MDRKEQHTRDLLRRWISGDITAREESELRRAAQEDEALRDAFAGYEANADEDHNARLARIRARSSGKRAGGRVRSLVAWRVAAAVLLLLAVAWWLVPISQDNAMSAPLAVEETTSAKDEAIAETEPALPPETQSDAVVAELDDFPEVSSGTSSPDRARDEAPVVIEGDGELILAMEESEPGVGLTSEADMVASEPAAFSDVSISAGAEDLGRLDSDSALADVVALEVEEVPQDPLVVSPSAPPPPAAAEKRSFPTQNQGYPTRLDERYRVSNVGPPVANEGYRIIEGKVLDSEGYPLIGASVIEEGTANGTVTDFDGFYRLAVDQDNASLKATYTGYEAQLIAIAQENEVDIIMEESGMLLDEVVVTGLGVRQQEERANAAGSVAPLDGFRALRRYINEQTPVNTPRVRITVQFVVEADGTLRDFEVLNSTNTAYNDFAIQLLQNGPAWQIEEGDPPITAVYVVRLKG